LKHKNLFKKKKRGPRIYPFGTTSALKSLSYSYSLIEKKNISPVRYENSQVKAKRFKLNEDRETTQ